MTAFLARPRAGALLTLSVSLLVSSAMACGGTGTNLFGSGGGSSSGGASTGTTGSSSSTGTTGSSSGTGTTGSSSGGGATASSSSGGGATASSSSGGGATASSSSGGGAATTSSSSGSVGCQAGYVCVDADPPGGAAGYYYVTETTLPAGAAPPCPANLTPHTDYEDPAGPAMCSACTCGPIQGASCSPPGLTCWAGSTTCGGATTTGTNWTPALQDGMCDMPANLLDNSNQLSCKITSAAMVSNPGSCTPSDVSFPNQGSWGTRVDVCGVDQAAGGCGMGQVCIPQGSGAPTESLCVRLEGVSTCPAGWTKTIAAYANATDTRDCGACTCGDGATCGDSHYTFYDTATCTSAMANGSINVGAASSTQCTDVSSEISQPAWSAKATLPQVHGSCPVGGGQPTGSVTPENPVTYCCQ